MPITTNPSTNSFLQLSDMDEPVTKSRKYLLTNLVTKAEQAASIQTSSLRLLSSQILQANTNVLLSLTAGAASKMWIAATNDLNFTLAANPVDGASVEIAIIAGETNRNLTFEFGLAAGAPKPSVIQSNTVGWLYIDYWTALTNARVIFSPGF